MNGTVLVVGASGFVGQVVCRDLLRRGYRVRAAARSAADLPPGVEAVTLPDLAQPGADWTALLDGADHVVYLAARVHVMNDTHPDPLAAYRAINRDAPVALARAAAQAGVRRLVYLSSIKVNGEGSRRPFTEEDRPQPTDPYGVSKWEAEQALLEVGRETGLAVVVIRPPLVYGPGVKANFMSLARAAGKGWPLPLGAVDNRRSLIYVENLADLIALTLEHPAAAGQVFLASDGEDLSTADLTRRLAEAQGRTPNLPAVPVGWLRLAGRLTGRTAVIDRLLGSLQVSSDKARRDLAWTPPYPVWQAVARTGASVTGAHAPGAAGRVRLSAGQRAYLLVRSPVERVLAAGMLVLLSPLLLLIAAVIRLDSPGPVLFRQERAGRRHEPFIIYKFRTMRAGTPHLSTEDMLRSGLSTVTRAGGFLRRTSLDELPQLLNVIRGEMSFVGPRPALMTQHPVLTLRQASGADVLAPGITGYAQVTGRDDLSDAEKVERDTAYLRRISLAMDLNIVLLTVGSIFKGTGTK
ncbi:hybrid nucleoside-diphosphate sugar epimerase/sugar transferase [Deinococcus ficus]|uniref:Sugar transferase n=1 Tax=Deinococcus ficus TaxID=317577 RepID=A0A221T244_9DEIO|nr:hybrid nucleoside-diphosphate sugar epimerase/sugar transferase [Deinococcus ficus]ASN82978.1 sugar transferase [Deinococcus ficus]